MTDVVASPGADGRPGNQDGSPMWMTDLLSQRDVNFNSLISTCTAASMTLGTGFNVIQGARGFILDHIEEELVFVTCFWAKSESLSQVSDLLLVLSQKALARNRKIRVRICVSSLSLLQKLFHTWSPKGKIYKASEWTSTFQIPSAHNLTGLDLQIKSVFIPPFSVMHSKFMVVDRKLCLLPSCNVSWENWFEGCLDLRGPVVSKFVDYWESFWGRGDPKFSLTASSSGSIGIPQHLHIDGENSANAQNSMSQKTSNGGSKPFEVASQPSSSTPILLPISIGLSFVGIRTVFLPSPHHQNPRFRPFPWQKAPDPPRTPLNVFTLQALEGCQRRIYLQTPNVTSPPVLDAITRALNRGVDVHIVTNEQLMWLEQIVTAGTSTPRCMRKLIKTYEKLQRQAGSQVSVDGGEAASRKGDLKIEYFAPAETRRDHSWPVASHLKLTIVDGQTVILGSGNMDRASWYTSQELGVALVSKETAESISKNLEAALKDRVKCVYNSGV